MPQIACPYLSEACLFPPPQPPTIRRQVVCFRVGTFGTVPLAAYSTAYAVEPIVFMVPRGISIGLANQV